MPEYIFFVFEVERDNIISNVRLSILSDLITTPQELCPIMPRNYVRVSNKQLDRTNLEKAFKYRVETGCSLKVAAEMFGVKKTTLTVS